mgnify:FL=1
MSQNSDELIERFTAILGEEFAFTLDLRHVAQKLVAVLGEAAKPAPGGPKMREGWQPIATAPKDGRDFLVWNRENRVRKARWYERSSSDLGISLYEGDGVNSFKGGIQPTHWMPLPAPPEPIVPEVPARVDGEGE